MSAHDAKANHNVGLISAIAAGAAVGMFAGYNVEGLLLRPGRNSTPQIMAYGTVIGAAVAGLVWLHEGRNRSQSGLVEKAFAERIAPSQTFAEKLQQRRMSPDNCRTTI